MLFLLFNNLSIKFVKEKKFIQTAYITTNALLIIRQIKLINKKKIATITLNNCFKTLVIYIVAFKALRFSKIMIYFF